MLGVFCCFPSEESRCMLTILFIFTAVSSFWQLCGMKIMVYPILKVFCYAKNGPNSFVAGASSRTPQGSLRRSPVPIGGKPYPTPTRTPRRLRRLIPLSFPAQHGQFNHMQSWSVVLVSPISSSAVAERPRDALCLSVVSFNSVIPREQSFIIVNSSMPTIKCCSVVFGVTLRLLIIHFVVVFRHQQTPPLTSVVSSTRHGPSLLNVLHLPLEAYTARGIGLQSRFLHTQSDLHSTSLLGEFPSEYCYDVWYGKTLKVWLPDGAKLLKICLFVSTEFTNLTDRRTDTQTQHYSIDRACTASRGNKTRAWRRSSLVYLYTK